jgi:hypothetical protein
VYTTGAVGLVMLLSSAVFYGFAHDPQTRCGGGSKGVSALAVAVSWLIFVVGAIATAIKLVNS